MLGTDVGLFYFVSVWSIMQQSILLRRWHYVEVKMIFRGFTSSLEKRSHYCNKENECIDSC